MVLTREDQRFFQTKTTIEELERENLKLRIENERLKGYLTKELVPKGIHFYKQQEFQIIEGLSNQYPVKLLCSNMV